MAKQPRQQPIGFYGKFQPTGVDNSAAQRMQALAGLGETVAGIAEQFGIRKAEEAAPAEALQAVEEARTVNPETGEVSYGEVAQKSGWGSSVYQNTVINAQYAQRKTDTTIRLNEIAVDFADDPEGYETAAKAFYDATVDAAPIEIRQDLRSAMGPRISSNFQTINANFVANSEKQGQAILQDSINTALIDLENLTANGEDQLVAKELPLLYLTIDAMGEADPLYNVEGAKNKVNNVLYEQRALKTLNDIADKDGIPAAMTALEELQDKPLNQGYSQADRRSFTISAQEDLSRKNSRINASGKVSTNEARLKTQAYITAKSNGIEVMPEDRDEVYALAEGTLLKEDLMLADELAIFASASRQAQAEIMTAAREGGLDRTDAYVGMAKVYADVRTQATKDGISFGVAQGIIPADEVVEFNPFIIADDPSTPDIDELAVNTLAFQTRQRQAKEMSAHYGVRVSPLTDAETAMISDQLPDMTIKARTALVNYFGTDSPLWGKLAGKNEGVFAQAAARGDANVMGAIFKGLDLKKNNYAPNFQGAQATDAQNIFNETVGNVYLPNDKRTTQDAALMYYYGNGGPAELDESAYRSAIQAVTGGVETIRGVKTQLVPEVTADQLDDYFQNFPEEDLVALGVEALVVDKPSVTFDFKGLGAGFVPRLEGAVSVARNALMSGRVVAIAGQGNYHIYKTDGKVLTNKEGNAVIFNVTKEKIGATPLGQLDNQRRQSEIDASLADKNRYKLAKDR